MDPADHLIVALDVPSGDQALTMVERFNGQVRWFKIGLELYLGAGPSIVTRLSQRGFQVFLDLKLHDIPNTVASAIRAVAPLGPSLLTVHAAGGPVMLAAAQEAASSFPHVQLLAVTVLTSMDQRQLSAIGVHDQVAQQVLSLGHLALAGGLPGLVCSAEETSMLRTELDPATLLIVPGIRTETSQANGQDSADDQQRVATPRQAIERGASMLVVGRPITRAADPAAAASRILDQIAKALESQSRTGEL